MFRSPVLCITLSAFALNSVSMAQTSRITGTVTRDTADNRLPGVEVSITAIGRSAKANYLGEFRLDRLPAGTHVLTFRQIGFEVLSDTVTVAENGTVDRWFLMRPSAVDLGPVVTTGVVSRTVSPALREFEERRKQGFGHFISDSVLRDGENRDFANLVIARIPGLSRFRVPQDDRGGHGQIYVGSARKCGNGPAISSCSGPGSYCPVTLYVDGVLVFNSANQQGTAEIPDFSQFRAAEYGGVEYYPGGAALPVRFNATASGCGVLLLWTREK